MADLQVIVDGQTAKHPISDDPPTEEKRPAFGDGGCDDNDELEEALSGGEEVDDEEDEEEDDADQLTGRDGGVASRTSSRRRHRRGKSSNKKRKWKPYNKLTWEEKRELEARESRRANRIRAERFAHGQPLAPYNTTQFLMDDHNVQEPDLDNIVNGHPRQHRESTGTLDSDEYYSSPEDEEEFLQKEFCVVYDNIHAERLSSMTKHELIQEYMQLEDRVEKLEQKLKSNSGGLGGGEIKSIEDLEKIRIFQQEMRKLAEENERLRRENSVLREVRCSGGDVDEQMAMECLEHSEADDDDEDGDSVDDEVEEGEDEGEGEKM